LHRKARTGNPTDAYSGEVVLVARGAFRWAWSTIPVTNEKLDRFPWNRWTTSAGIRTRCLDAALCSSNAQPCLANLGNLTKGNLGHHQVPLSAE
jgi:hypothetical protein